MIQIETPASRRGLRPGVEVFELQAYTSGHSATHVVAEQTVEEDPARFTNVRTQGGVPVFAWRVVVSEVVDRDSVAAVRADAGGEDAGVPPLAEGKHVEREPGHGDRAQFEGHVSGDALVIFDEFEAVDEEPVVLVILLARGEGDVLEVHVASRVEDSVGALDEVLALADGSTVPNPTPPGVEVVAHPAARESLLPSAPGKVRPSDLAPGAIDLRLGGQGAPPAIEYDTGSPDFHVAVAHDDVSFEGENVGNRVFEDAICLEHDLPGFRADGGLAGHSPRLGRVLGDRRDGRPEQENEAQAGDEGDDAAHS